MAAYLAPPQDSNAAGPVKGKMIVIDMGKREIDWDVSYDLPDYLKASKPEEVGTVVLTTWQNNKVAEYTNGTAGYQYTDPRPSKSSGSRNGEPWSGKANYREVPCRTVSSRSWEGGQKPW